MIGRCIGNSRSHIVGTKAARSFASNVRVDDVGLVLGQDYVIWGVFFRDGFAWYLVCEESTDDFPKPHFGEFFDLVDDRIPPGWSLCTAAGNLGSVALLPGAWARDPAFLEKLVEGTPGAKAVFDDLRRRVDMWHSRESPVGGEVND